MYGVAGCHVWRSRVSCMAQPVACSAQPSVIYGAAECHVWRSQLSTASKYYGYRDTLYPRYCDVITANCQNLLSASFLKTLPMFWSKNGPVSEAQGRKWDAEYFFFKLKQ